ncbi:MAG: DNA repair protein RecN [Rhodocyclaceae bacterium]|nr:DNA repair protein RecN [Rhodocyclaceae bacterium]
MLHRLVIRDFVLIDRLELEFPRRFGALTGETGAGKSILVDALAFVLGARADAQILRQGAMRAEVSALFTLDADHPARAWLEDHDLFDDAEEELLLRRVLGADGRSRAYIGAAPATLAQLRELGESLVAIHGQHGHLALMRPEIQRQTLDRHLGADGLARQVADSYRTWRQAQQRLHASTARIEALSQERELLSWQLQELEQLELSAESWAALNIEHGRLANLSTLLTGIGSACAALDDADQGLGRQVLAQISRLEALQAIDPDLATTIELLRSASIALDEASHALRRHAERLEPDPDRLAELDARLAGILQIARKYRVAPEAIPDHADTLRARLAELAEVIDLSVLAEEVQRARREYDARARALSAQRRGGAPDFGRAVSALMHELAMPGGELRVTVLDRDEAAAQGNEDVEFLVSAHSAQPPGALASVASGGELARIGLALQALASTGDRRTLIFDEVDVGIGGATAEIVGRLLRRLGTQHQVLCVTHLPQVAAQADWQWSVSKSAEAGTIASEIRPLDATARIEEIARMLGGTRITATTRRHAAEMLAAAGAADTPIRDNTAAEPAWSPQVLDRP